MDGAILLKDKPGEKLSTHLVGAFKRTSTVNILRGELLVPIPGDKIIPRNDGQKPHNYQVKRDPTITLFTEDDVAPLGSYEFLLLEGIQSRDARFQAFISDGYLDWGMKLKPGNEVYVVVPGFSTGGNTAVPTPATPRAAAKVRFVGGLGIEPLKYGITFGVEIMEKKYLWRGTTDGTFQDHRYFQCRVDCGLFVSLEKLSPDREGSTLAKAPSAGQEYGTGGALNNMSGPEQGSKGGSSHDMTTRSKAKEKGSGQDSSVDPPSPQFVKGDRVKVYNKKGIAVHGTVRWVGRKTAARDFKYTVVGIETDVKVRMEDFELSQPGMAHLFAAKDKKCQLGMPEELVLHESDQADVKGGQQKPPTQPPATNLPVGKRHPEDKAALAKEIGMSEEEMLAVVAEEEEVLKQAADEKAKQLAKKVMPDESIDVKQQQAAIQEYEREQEKRRAQQRDIGLREKEQFSTQSGGGHATHLRHDQLPGPEYQGQPCSQNAEGRNYGKQHSWQLEHVYDEIPGPGLPRRGSENTLAARADPHQHDIQNHPQQSPALVHQPLPSQQPLSQSQSAYQPPVPGAHQQPPTYPQPVEQPSHPQIQYQETQAYTHPPDKPHHRHLNHQLSIGSTVQLSDPPRYGVIRWIGELPGVDGMIAGLEMEADLDGCTDGTWRGTGQKYFHCPPGKGMFCPLGNLESDHRFTVPGAVPGSAVMKNPLDGVPYSEEADQLIKDHQFEKYLGERRGIQGHQNSCYLDATVFGLFALSDVFDDMFLKEPDSPAGKEVSTLLWKGIVNPLRKNGVVRHESVMSMRNKLEELGKMKGVNLDEKDPEEFLNMLFKHTLDVDPFISIKRPFGVEKEFFVQLFLEFDEEMKLPTVGDLLVKMFKEQHISFTRVPSKLMIQVPRYGKQFKTFKRIIPDLMLDVTTLTESPYHCTVCGGSAWCKCPSCTAEFKRREPKDPHHVYFCDDCNKKVHSAYDRSNHQMDRVIPNEGNVTQLELLSVICIETSHYVCFALKDERWLFFDSMANRVFDTYNIPKGVDCTLELNEWVYRGDHQRLLTTPPRQIPEYVRRFTQDVYMCVYIQPDAAMY